MDDTNSDDGGITRRSVLRRGATAAGAVAGTAAVTGNAAAQDKRGGRGQIDGEARRNDPFTVGSPGTTDRMASCMAADSATQTYLSYEITYCSDGETATLYVIPDDAPLAPGEEYLIRSSVRCRATDNDRVAFGPSNQNC